MNIAADWYEKESLAAILKKDPDLHPKLVEFVMRLDDLPGTLNGRVVTLYLPGWIATFTRERTKQELMQDEIDALKRRVAELEGK